MDRGENSVTESSSDVAILDQQVLGVLWELRSFEDADGWGQIEDNQARSGMCDRT